MREQPLATISLPIHARCRKCKYKLKGLPEPICPECGTGFDPGDPSTYRIDRRVSLWRGWARPPSRRYCWVAAVATVIYLLGATNPVGVFGLMATGEPFLPGVFALIVCVIVPIVIGFDFALRATSSLANIVFPPDESMQPGKGRGISVRWFVAPACAVIAASALLTEWPLAARFGASRAEFERTATKVLAAASKPVDPLSYFGEHVPADRWVGWYYVQLIRVDSVRGTVEFIIDGSSMAWWGFYFDPTGRTGFASKPIIPAWYPYFYAK
jgi:hypothetical protein